MVAFHFRLFLPDGEDVGDFVTAAPDWSAGDEFFTGGRLRYRVRAVIPADDLDETDGNIYQGVFEVEPVA